MDSNVSNNQRVALSIVFVFVILAAIPLSVFFVSKFGPEAALAAGGALLVIGALGKTFENNHPGRLRWSRKRCLFLFVSGALFVLSCVLPGHLLDLSVMGALMLVSAIRS